jgi:hypothetical protein
MEKNMDNFEEYERFTYKLTTGPDLAPPHTVWDNAKNTWAECGSFGTEAEASACAYGMNRGREICRRNGRSLSGILSDLRRAVRSVEGAIIDDAK